MEQYYTVCVHMNAHRCTLVGRVAALTESCLTALGPRNWLWVAAAGLASLPNSDLRGQKSCCYSQDQNSRPLTGKGRRFVNRQAAFVGLLSTRG